MHYVLLISIYVVVHILNSVLRTSNGQLIYKGMVYPTKIVLFLKNTK